MEQNINNSYKKLFKAKKKTINISRPATDIHNLTIDINNEFEKNKLSDFNSKLSLILNPNAEEFIPKSLKILNKENKEDHKKDIDLPSFNASEFKIKNNKKILLIQANNRQININENNFAQKGNNKTKKKVEILNSDSKSFIQKRRENKNKDENQIDKREFETKNGKFNINSKPYIPLFLRVKEKKDMTYSNEENKIKRDKKNKINNSLSYFGEAPFNSNKIKEKEDNSKEDLIQKDLKNNLNLLSFNNYNTIKEQIFEKIKDDVNIQYEFSELLFQQVILEKEDNAKIISKLVKELDKGLP